MEKSEQKIEAAREKGLKSEFKLFFERHFKKSEFWNSKIILWLLGLNLASNLANWLIIAIFINHLDGDIILHYNVYFGVDELGNWKQAFLLPIIGIILFALNAVLAAWFYAKKERIASHILLLASLMAQWSLIIAAASLIMINY